jgi:type I restriction enzyme, S subunit
MPRAAKHSVVFGQRMMLIRAGATLDAAFLEMVMNSPLITGIALAKTTGGAAPRINVATVKAYPIPLPPLVEQHRVVAKAGFGTCG